MTTTAKRKTKNAAQRLIEIVKKYCDLWQGQDGKGYASFTWKGAKQNWRIHSPQFAQWLISEYWRKHGNTPNNSAIASVKDLIEAMAQEGDCHAIYQRVARVDDKIFVDLGGASWRVVEVSADGWQIVDNAPVKFIRNDNTGELPLPEQEGSLDLLRPLCSSVDGNWTLIKGFIMDAFKGHKPYFVLSVSGVQGSNKSSLCRLLKKLIDPVRQAELSAPPREPRALAVDVKSEYLLAYDNLSYIHQWLSDALCSISTGAGFKDRTLYTDDEQNIIGGARPICFNGIPRCADSPDLLDRAILIEQPEIAPDQRKTEKALNLEYEQIKSKVFGGILDLLVKGLRDLPTTNLEQLDRMADSSQWATACLGQAFLDVYLDNKEEATEVGIENSPIAKGIIELCETLPKLPYQTTTDQLLKMLNDIVPYENKGPDFPKNAKSLGHRLKRDMPNLKKKGIVICRDRSKEGSLITIRKPEEEKLLAELNS